MDEEKDKLSIEVAELYYQLNYSQQQIANQLEISRPTVSRLLQYAKDRGYVQIKISDPFMDIRIVAREACLKISIERSKCCLFPY